MADESVHRRINALVSRMFPTIDELKSHQDDLDSIIAAIPPADPIRPDLEAARAQLNTIIGSYINTSKRIAAVLSEAPRKP